MHSFRVCDNMGTSTMSSDQLSEKHDKLAKLNARKKELEVLLAAKNEELYKLCVDEVKLTGVMPPEAPLSPETQPQGRERLGSVRSAGEKILSDGEESLRCSGRRYRQPYAERVQDPDQISRKNLTQSHRLSTPSISGMSTKSGPSRLAHIPRSETSCSNYYLSSPPDPAETFSMHTSHTYPSLATKGDHTPTSSDQARYGKSPVDLHGNNTYRHHTVTNENMNKIYYNTLQPEPQNVSRMRETHFSASHPNITTHYTHAAASAQVQPTSQNGASSTPLLYQYASHLKSENQHLSSLGQPQQPPIQSKRREIARRNPLQRTQTYHLTSHSDYNNHLENMNSNFPQLGSAHGHRIPPNVISQQSRYLKHPYADRVQKALSPTSHQNQTTSLSQTLAPTVTPSEEYHYYDHPSYANVASPPCPTTLSTGFSVNSLDNQSVFNFSPQSIDNVDSKVREKHWYETSLDSPTGPTSRECLSATPRNIHLKWSPSMGNSQTYELMSPGPALQMESPRIAQAPPIPSSPQRDLPLESPKNCTVIEQGKWIPYREVTKPFEMSDFYKYSTKFRQANQKSNDNIMSPTMTQNQIFPKYANEFTQHSRQDEWQTQNN